jgi:hypothetical protein
MFASAAYCGATDAEKARNGREKETMHSWIWVGTGSGGPAAMPPEIQDHVDISPLKQ